jgi:hypothetical protein
LRHPHFVWTAVFRPDGTRVLTSGREQVWRLWRLPEAEQSSVGPLVRGLEQGVNQTYDRRQVLRANARASAESSRTQSVIDG